MAGFIAPYVRLLGSCFSHLRRFRICNDSSAGLLRSTPLYSLGRPQQRFDLLFEACLLHSSRPCTHFPPFSSKDHFYSTICVIIFPLKISFLHKSSCSSAKCLNRQDISPSTTRSPTAVYLPAGCSQAWQTLQTGQNHHISLSLHTQLWRLIYFTG